MRQHFRQTQHFTGEEMDMMRSPLSKIIQFNGKSGNNTKISMFFSRYWYCRQTPEKKEQSESFLFLTNEHTGTLCFTAFHFSVLWRYCKLKACGNPLLRKSTGAVFSTAPAHFVPLGYILVYLLK